MKSIYLAVFCILMASTPVLYAQTIPNTTSSRMDASVATAQTAQTNAQYWAQEVKLQPNNAGAWVQYYQWTERDKSIPNLRRQNELETIQTSVKSFAGGSWGDFLIRYLHSGMLDTAALQNAVSLSGNDAMVLPYALQSAIIWNDREAQKMYGQKLNAIAPLSEALYRYHLDCLMSAEPGSTIYAKGLHDLVPLSILQQIYGIRTDIRLKYYAEKINRDSTAYLCLSLGKAVLEQYPNARYTGLLVKLNSQKNTIDVLEENMNEIFSRGNLPLSILQGEEKLIYRNYLPALILLYKNYEKADAVKSTFFKTRILEIAAATESSASVTNIIGL